MGVTLDLTPLQWAYMLTVTCELDGMLISFPAFFAQFFPGMQRRQIPAHQDRRSYRRQYHPDRQQRQSLERHESPPKALSTGLMPQSRALRAAGYLPGLLV